MKVKEAIEFLKSLRTVRTVKLHKVFGLLKRGEKCKEENKVNKKYRQIWKEFNHYPHITTKNTQELIKELKQKYFPKEKNEESRINRTKIKKNKN